MTEDRAKTKLCIKQEKSNIFRFYMRQFEIEKMIKDSDQWGDTDEFFESIHKSVDFLLTGDMEGYYKILPVYDNLASVNFIPKTESIILLERNGKPYPLVMNESIPKNVTVKFLLLMYDIYRSRNEILYFNKFLPYLESYLEQNKDIVENMYFTHFSHDSEERILSPIVPLYNEVEFS